MKYDFNDIEAGDNVEFTVETMVNEKIIVKEINVIE
jgi:hypothetical protein